MSRARPDRQYRCAARLGALLVAFTIGAAHAAPDSEPAPPPCDKPLASVIVIDDQNLILRAAATELSAEE